MHEFFCQSKLAAGIFFHVEGVLLARNFFGKISLAGIFFFFFWGGGGIVNPLPEFLMVRP